MDLWIWQYTWCKRAEFWSSVKVDAYTVLRLASRRVDAASTAQLGQLCSEADPATVPPAELTQTDPNFPQKTDLALSAAEDVDSQPRFDSD